LRSSLLTEIPDRNVAVEEARADLNGLVTSDAALSHTNELYISLLAMKRGCKNLMSTDMRVKNYDCAALALQNNAPETEVAEAL
jgi:hypothetical protein